MMLTDCPKCRVTTSPVNGLCPVCRHPRPSRTRNALLGAFLAGYGAIVGGCSERPAAVSAPDDPMVAVALQLAVDEWVDVCGVTLSVDSDGLPVREGHVPDGHGAMTTDEGITYRRIDAVESMRTMLAHELGHVLYGPEHTTGGIMDADDSRVRHVTVADCR